MNLTHMVLSSGEACIHLSRCNRSVIGAVRTQKRKRKHAHLYRCACFDIYRDSLIKRAVFQEQSLGFLAQSLPVAMFSV